MPYSKLHPFTAALLLSFFPALSLTAANLKSAEITAIVNDVSVINAGQGTRPAKLDETISGRSSVQTGIKSRTELLFSDKTMARLGANSMFSFTDGTRDIDLKQGTMLLQVPKGAGGAKITTAAVTAAITGTTIMIEYFPGGFTKVIVLEGTLRLFLNNRVGESTLLGPGKMVILNPNAKQIPEPVDVDIKRLVKTSKLVQAIDGTDMDLKIVEGEIANQEKQKGKGDLIGTNLVITGSGTEVILASEDLLNTLQNAAPEQQELLGDNTHGSGGGPNPPTPPAPPGPTKYNPVTTITGPSPYVINNTTSIVTDPTITTGGITDQGTLYNSAKQGSFTQFLFGSTSGFDSQFNFDAAYQNGDFSVFSFSGLELSGNPTVDTTGGPSNLFLVSEKNISTTPGPFALDFSSLNFVGLIAENGYVSLGSSITSLNGPSTLHIIARGTDTGASQGKVFIDAPITLAAGNVGIYGESGISVSNSIKADFIALQSTGDISLSNSAFLDANQLNIFSTGTVTFNAANIDASGLNSFTVDGNTINFSGNGGFSSANANFTAGTGGFTATATSNFYAASLLSSGNITISNIFTNPATVNISGIIAASGNINIDGNLTAGSIGAANNISAKSLSSSTNINSTLGNIMTTGGNMTATNNITAAGSITSSSSIVAGDLLKGSDITAGSGISGGSIESTTGDIKSTGGSITSTTGGIVSAGNITAKTGISSAGDITASGTLGTTDAGTITSSLGAIVATFLNGPTSAGTNTFKALASIYASAIANSSGTVLLRSPNISLVSATGGITNIDSFQFDDPTDRTLENLLIYTNGIDPVTITMSGDVGTYANPITDITTDTQVSWTGATHNFYADKAGTGSITAKELFVTNLNTGSGDLIVNTINRTHQRNVEHDIVVGGNLQVSSGILFSGSSGAAPEDGGNVTLSAPVVNFGSSSNMVSAVSNVGGNSTGTAAGGKGGTFGATSTSGNMTANSGADISAGGGGSIGGRGGDGGQIGLATSSVLSGKTASFSNTLSVMGGSGISGGNGGSLDVSSNTIFFGPGSATNSDGGSASTGTGGNGGFTSITSTGDNVNVTTSYMSSFYSKGGNSISGQGGNGSQVQITTAGNVAPINVDGTFITDGGSTGLNGGHGGNGGYVNGFANGSNSDITVGTTAATLSANGGDSTTGNSTGGNGGTIYLASIGGNVTVASGANLSATTGLNHGSTTAGGNGGTILVEAKRHANIAGVLKVSSNDVPNKRVSAGAGNITITSTETDAGKPGITIANTSQLLSLLNAAAPNGSGGMIKFQSSGGKIAIAGAVQADKGTIYASNPAANGRIDIANTATLRADVIKAEVLGSNGTLTINGGGSGGLNADSQIKLMANQSTGTVLFTGGIINLTAPTILVNAHTVTVTGDTRVNNNGATTVGAVNHNYTNGVGPTGLGGFRDAVTQTGP